MTFRLHQSTSRNDDGVGGGFGAALQRVYARFEVGVGGAVATFGVGDVVAALVVGAAGAALAVAVGGALGVVSVAGTGVTLGVAWHAREKTTTSPNARIEEA